jgi:hypothetical protein
MIALFLEPISLRIVCYAPFSSLSAEKVCRPGFPLFLLGLCFVLSRWLLGGCFAIVSLLKNYKKIMC